MNLKTIAAAAAFAMLGSSAFAQAYVGVAAGATNACVGTNVTGGCPKHAADLKATVGYIWPGTDFAIEGIYDHLGTFKRSTSEGSSHFNVDTFGIGGAWRPQFGAGWGGVLRAGMDYGQVRTTTHYFAGPTPAKRADTSYTSGSWQPYVGAGLTYAITSSLSLEGGLDLTRIRAGSTGPTSTATALTIGLNFKF